jgi:lipopolysaccharide transport system ATP-binding protein
MSSRAITIENLSKAYRIGLKEQVPDSLVGAVQGVLQAPWKNWRRLQRLNTYRVNGEADDVVWALRDVSFEVSEGEVLGIIGHNGAGKSTLLKILSRITEPTSGRAIIRGRVSSLLEVGTGFHPELSGRENVYLNGTILGMTKREIDRKFDEIVDFSGVEKFLDTPIKRYSSGMRVRLAFSVAANLEPEILFIDEVLAVGDHAFQQKCMGRMQNISQQGRTVLFVSHHVPAIQRMCRNVMVLDEGRVKFHGQCEQGIQSYLEGACPYTEADIDLSTHAGRRPGSVPILSRIRLVDQFGRPSSQYRCGDRMTMELTLEPYPGYAAVHCWIQVCDELSTRLFTVGTDLSDESPAVPDRRVTIEGHIDDLPLAPGNYYLTLHAGPRGQRTADVIVKAISFSVVDSNYYGNGRLPSASRGRFLVRSRWKVFDEMC